MHDYRLMRQKHGLPVSQTIDSPILIFDWFELGDAFAALGIVLVFGVLFYCWQVMTALLVVQIGLGPYIRKKNERGIFLHWPYKTFGISLPGLINTGGMGKRYSD